MSRSRLLPALALATATAAATATPAAAAAVKPGVYQGTAGGQALSIRVLDDGRAFHVERFKFHATCEDGHWVENKYWTEGRSGQTAIGRDGRFAHRIGGDAPLTISGRFAAGTVRGSIRLGPWMQPFPASVVPPRGADLRCATKRASFTLKRR